MKKSKSIALFLVAASVAQFLSSCDSEKEKKPHSRLHLRADTTIGYTRMYPVNNHGVIVYPYYVFTPYGSYNENVHAYSRGGYYNSRTYASSVSHNSPVARGGFGTIGTGGHGFSVGS